MTRHQRAAGYVAAQGYEGQIQRRVMNRDTWRRVYRNARRVVAGQFTGSPAVKAAVDAAEWTF